MGRRRTIEDASRRAETERVMGLRVKQLSGTALEFVHEVSRGYAVDMGKLGLGATLAWLLARVFGVAG